MVLLCVSLCVCVCVCSCIYHLHTQCRVALVSAAQCEPPSIRPSDLPCQQTQENKEACGSASGYRSSPLCSRSAGSHRSRSQFNLLYLTDQELWDAANETGPSPVRRTLNRPTQSKTMQSSGVHSDMRGYLKLQVLIELIKGSYWLKISLVTAC